MESIGIAEVAALAGVSPATVSRALRGIPGVAAATRSSVRAAAEQLGYVASPSAASLSTGRAGALGVISPWFSRWFFASAVEGVQSEVLTHTYDLLLYPATLAVSADVHRVNLRSIHKRVDGVIAINVPISVEQFADFRVPVVTLGSHYPGISAVSVDDVCVGETATEHLLSLGHRTIAFLGQDPDRLYGFTTAADRLTGFRRALTTAGHEVDERLIETTGFSTQGGAESFRRLWSAVEAGRVPRPTAIFAVCDEVAMGIIHHARGLGLRVPEDLSVIGVDDHDLSYLYDLTTVWQPVREQGAMASRLLLERIADPRVAARHEFVDPRLVVRGTTAAAAR
ncbi:LacI family DNA-binding transcriptional regulator [Nakamurella deserti]|uniref:LacI family DNA-binding transcriptional regulator n=1 Tax=Nakamurella deserti TaxID=2164074 RepID=UPI000DBE79DB|nr:LacI family DNA-binding transcriptional regulator [Nakamurella deserti]